MALAHNFQQLATRCQSSGEISFKQNWKSSVSSAPSISSSETTDGCFECNICLDSANEPVVTLCGHLYCWPCIYKWLQRSSLDSTDQPKCPVCKSNISNSSMVPLYGRGNSRPKLEPKKPQPEPVIPSRPPALGLNALLSMASNENPQLHSNHFQPQPFHHHQYLAHPLGNYVPAGPLSSYFSPTVGMFREMVFARMFGSSENLFSYPNSYHPLVGTSGSSPRVRRQELEVEKSLNRLSIFLLCCLISCLFLFWLNSLTLLWWWVQVAETASLNECSGGGRWLHCPFYCIYNICMYESVVLELLWTARGRLCTI